jgi:membrane-associated protease RseP (regulator of RpoE activity)
LPYPELSSPTEEKVVSDYSENQKNRPDKKTVFKHSVLFVLTFLCVSVTGILWVGQTANAETFFDMLPEGILFAAVFLLFLACHEFGHYFAAVYHNIRVTLPYFIPVPFGIGTLGAVIRIKEKIEDSRKLFDVGISGPIAGFVVSLATLMYGFFSLPGPEFIYNFDGHDEVIAYVEAHGTWPESPPEESEGMLMVMGNTILYSFLAGFFDNAPPMWEMYHYPFLFAGWLGLFFTALNLMPVGQLDGGHILYSLIGFRNHRKVARIAFGGITVLAGIEAIPFIHTMLVEWNGTIASFSILFWALLLFFLLKRAFHNEHNWITPVWVVSIVLSVGFLFLAGNGMDRAGSLIWVFWSFFLTFFVGLEHPPAIYEQNLTPVRKVLGWTSMAIFVLCISPNPIYFLN